MIYQPREETFTADPNNPVKQFEIWKNTFSILNLSARAVFLFTLVSFSLIIATEVISKRFAPLTMPEYLPRAFDSYDNLVYFLNNASRINSQDIAYFFIYLEQNPALKQGLAELLNVDENHYTELRFDSRDIRFTTNIVRFFLDSNGDLKIQSTLNALNLDPILSEFAYQARLCVNFDDYFCPVYIENLTYLVLDESTREQFRGIFSGQLYIDFDNISSITYGHEEPFINTFMQREIIISYSDGSSIVVNVAFNPANSEVLLVAAYTFNDVTKRWDETEFLLNDRIDMLIEDNFSNNLREFLDTTNNQ